MVQGSHTHIRYKNVFRARYHNMEITCQQILSNSFNEKIFFTTAALNTVPTIAAESSDVASASATDNFSNVQDYVEVDHSKTNNNDISSVQYPITKYNDGNDTQIIITEDIAASVLLELQSQWVTPESHDYLKTDFVLLESMEDPPKESKKENKAMIAQSILSCTEKCNDVINSLKNCMYGSKSIPRAKKYVHLSLKTLKEVTKYV